MASNYCLYTGWYMANLPKNEVTVAPQKVIKIPQFCVIPSPKYSTSPKKPWFSREIPTYFWDHRMGGVQCGGWDFWMGTFLSQFRTPLEDHCSTGAIVGTSGQRYQKKIELSKSSIFFWGQFLLNPSRRSLHLFQILTPCGFRAAVAGALEVVQALLEARLCEKGWVLVSGESFHLGTFFIS